MGKKVKLVERADRIVKSILIRNNPWYQMECGRSKCIPCSQTDKETASGCSKRNVVYESSCGDCKLRGIKVRYIGETSRSLKERSAEHLKDSSNSEDTLGGVPPGEQDRVQVQDPETMQKLL